MDFNLQLEESFQALVQQPQRFNEISKQVILQLVKIHSTRNRLLPAEFVAQIIDQLYAINAFENRKLSLKFCFYYNILRHIILANFNELKDNKVFAVIAMIYAQKLSQFYHQVESQEKSLAILRHVAQITVINQISLKYIQKSKIFFPQYIKALEVSVQRLLHSISRNLRHSSKGQVDSSQYNTMEGVLQLAFSKDTEKSELVFILVGLLNFVLKQASSFFTANTNKKQLLTLPAIQSIITKLQQLNTHLPQTISSQLQIPPEFKKYVPNQNGQTQNNEDEPIYLEEPIKVRQLTPRFYDEEQGTQNKLLRKKKNKLEKRMQLQLRESASHRLQEKRVVENVRKDKIKRQVNKELFILQKQTQEAKKAFKQVKKVKSIKKQAKLGRKGKK